MKMLRKNVVTGKGAHWWKLAVLVASACYTILGVSGRSATWYQCRHNLKLNEFVDIGKMDDTVTLLDLRYCNLTSLKPDFIKCYPNLRSLKIGHNRISHFVNGTFDALTELNTLSLINNTFLGSQLPINLFKNLDLNSITFSHNNMVDTPSELLLGSNLKHLYLTNCSLREFPAFVKRAVFPKMLYLHLRNNLISKLDDPEIFTNIVGLKKLQLEYNYIDFLHEDLLKPLTQIQRLHFNDNRIKSIPDGFFQNKSSLTFIDLSFNYIDYIPANSFLGTKNLRELSLANNRLTYLPVNFLSERQSTSVNLEIFYFYQNPWQCACLNEVLTEVKKLGLSYNHDLYDGQHPVCGINNSFKCHRKEFYQDLYTNFSSCSTCEVLRPPPQEEK